MDPSIIVGVEESERSLDALTLAARLAVVFDASLVLVNAYPWEPLGGEPPRPEYERLVRDQSLTLLDRTEHSLSLDRVRTVSIPTFSAARAMHDTAEAEAAAIIVLGATRRAVHGSTAAGSVAERLLGSAPCALAVAPKGYAQNEWSGSFRRIAAAYSPIGGDQAPVLAAGVIARRCRVPLTLIGVADPSVWAPDARAGRAGADELIAAQHAVMRRHLEEMRSLISGRVDTKIEILEGSPLQRLREASEGLDLLACGSRAYGPASRVQAGTVSTALVQASSCPVIVVPRELESPWLEEGPQISSGTISMALAGHSVAQMPQPLQWSRSIS